MGVAQLWIGRIAVGLLIGVAVIATLGFVTSGTRAVGTLALLLDSENATVVILAKVFECGLYWSAAIAYLRGSRMGLVVSLLIFLAMLTWGVIDDAMTPGFQIRFLKNHIVDLVPCILVSVLLCCLIWPGQRNAIGGEVD